MRIEMYMLIYIHYNLKLLSDLLKQILCDKKEWKLARNLSSNNNKNIPLWICRDWLNATFSNFLSLHGTVENYNIVF